MFICQFVSYVMLWCDIVVVFDVYLFSLFVVCVFDMLELYFKVMFFVGENGLGKFMFMEVIVVVFGFNVEGGLCNFNFSMYVLYFELYVYLCIVRGFCKLCIEFFLCVESFFNVVINIQQMDDELGLGGCVIDFYGG